MARGIKPEKNSERSHANGGIFLEELWKLFDILEKLDEEGDFATEMRAGEIEGPFYSNAEYNYNIKLGIEYGDFPFKKGFRPRTRPRSRRTSV